MGLSVVLTLLIVALIAIPSWRLGKRLGTPPGKRDATPEEQAEWRRERAVRRKAELAGLTTRERFLFFAYYAISIPAMPVGILLTVFGGGTTRTIGIGLLVAAVLLMAVPVGPILGGRVRRRKRADTA
jgi:hypothetical protein